MNPGQLRNFTASLSECISAGQPVPPFYTLAHEGEYVHRFDSQVTTFPAALGIGATGDTQIAYQVGLAAGQELAFSGINMVLGPVADVLLQPDNEVVNMRTFGGDPAVVSRFVSAMTAGYIEAGVIPVLKHFPGHGGVAGDTHKQLVVDGSDPQRIWSMYLPPFQAGLQAGASVVMLSHVAYPAISGNQLPGTITPEMSAFLRSELGFEGIILSDALDMKGIVNDSLGVEQAALEAIKSGVDLLLLNDPDDAQAAYQLIYSAANDGTSLPRARLDEAVRRVLRVKFAWGLHQARPAPPEPNWQADHDLAIQLGYRLVTRLKDTAGLIPLPAQYRKILLVSPITEEGWEAHSQFLDPALQEAGFQVEHLHYVNIPNQGSRDEGVKAALGDRAAAADLLLVFTWQAHLNRVTLENEIQVELAQLALESGKPVLFVALKSPTDVLAYPQATTVLATFGTSDGALSALADILVGKALPLGVNPLPGLP